MADLAESDGPGRCDENNQCRERQRNSYRSAWVHGAARWTFYCSV